MAQSRLNVDITTYNIVPDKSAIFYFCERDNLVGMQKPLQSGKAGLLDFRSWEGNPDRFETLIEIRNFCICQSCSWAGLEDILTVRS